MQKSSLPDHEIVWTDQEIVCCEGNDKDMGHPRVYYSLAVDEEVVCEYCGKIFRLKTVGRSNAH